MAEEALQKNGTDCSVPFYYHLKRHYPVLPPDNGTRNETHLITLTTLALFFQNWKNIKSVRQLAACGHSTPLTVKTADFALVSGQ